jgi:hypothetical protein
MIAKQALLLEPHLQSILLWLFWRWGVSQTICLGLAQTTILPSSWDYRREPLMPVYFQSLSESLKWPWTVFLPNERIQHPLGATCGTRL